MQKIKYAKKESICACKVSLDLLGDKWSLIIVRDIFREKYTFSEFLNESDESISSSILIDRLKKLISLKIIGNKLIYQSGESLSKVNLIIYLK